MFEDYCVCSTGKVLLDSSFSITTVSIKNVGGVNYRT